MSAPASPSASERIAAILDGCASEPGAPGSRRVARAVHLARRLQHRADALQTPHERKQQMELDRMIHSPDDKATLVELTDQAFRSHVAHRAADQLVHILDAQGIPRFFHPFDRTLLRGFQSFGEYLPGVAVPMVKEKMRQETANVVLPAETEMLRKHLRARWRENVRMNVNYLGEAILGETQARGRLNKYLEALQIPDIEVISVKISTLDSQISSIAREPSIARLCDRVELLFRAAAKESFERPDGSTCAKFVYLDMEEYRDMGLTAEVFMRTLDRDGLRSARAGIALQAYLPDSFAVQKTIQEWARGRVARGGAPVTIRIVKGANMEMERVEASLRDWPTATFSVKGDTDANYKRMLHETLRDEYRDSIRVGVATHNLFDLAYGLVFAAECESLDRVQFEMLEGMANAQRRAVAELGTDLLLYAPACGRDEFLHAIGYLIRRLDENTGPENFLRHAFKLKVDGPDWKRLERAFVDSFDRIATLSDQPRRTQNRSMPTRGRDAGPSWSEFRNEPDTDFALAHHAAWAADLSRRWSGRRGESAPEIPLIVAGQATGGAGDRPWIECRDPSRPGVVVGRYPTARDRDIEAAIRCAQDDPEGWRRRSHDERSALLACVANELRTARADLIGAAMAHCGKIATESDPEVSEAIDFVEFYRRTADAFSRWPGVAARGKGTVVVLSPWNFPIAIPCGGIAAGLAAGNTVILKPASDAVLPAYLLCDCFWRAGIPREALQFVPCSGSGPAQKLIADRSIAAVILTGGTATAEAILRARPDCPLMAETGGKNATIVTAMSDRDQAKKNVIHSAFSHSGQKCSATSLLLLEEEVYDDPAFRESLCDAVQSLPVGSAWDPRTRVNPLIRPPRGDLARALKELEPGESWALMPECREGNPNLYSPGIKWGVRPGGYTHRTEFFGPVLGVIRYRRLNEAIAIVNQTGYGLTSGLESLDDREQETWLRGIRAGNLYVNRPTTGAIVLRQPFGGVGKSSFGAGIKAGGPNYTLQLMEFESTAPGGRAGAVRDARLAELVRQFDSAARSADPCDPAGSIESGRIARIVADYERWAEREFGARHDHFSLVGQDNLRLYLPIAELRIRVDPRDAPIDTVLRVAAARAAGCRITVSIHPEADAAVIDRIDEATDSWAGGIEFVEETDDALAEAIRDGHTFRVRYAAPDRAPTVVRQAANDAAIFVADAPVLPHGRLELVWYVEEQSQSVNYHRYGNLGRRAGEPRRQPE